jgi:hypothetical protein
MVNAICPVGTACFRNSNVYAECRPSCPTGWACQTDVVGPNEQCGGMIYQKQVKLLQYRSFFFCFLGIDFIGITRCAQGLRCYARSKWYSHCAATCPGPDWAC